MRFAAGVEFDGTRFSGWQSQSGQRTVQDVVEASLSRVADHPVRVTTAGRTDAGVHASALIIHFDSGASRTDYQWLRGANTCLPDDVGILWVREVADDFHARFSALQRSYRYILLNRRTPSALMNGKAGWDYRPLDEKAMERASGCLIGKTRLLFVSGCGLPGAQSGARDPQHRDRPGCKLIWFDIVADGFLQHMVRNLVGSLAVIGAGEADTHWMREVLGRGIAGVPADRVSGRSLLHICTLSQPIPVAGVPACGEVLVTGAGSARKEQLIHMDRHDDADEYQGKDLRYHKRQRCCRGGRGGRTCSGLRLLSAQCAQRELCQSQADHRGAASAGNVGGSGGESRSGGRPGRLVASVPV